MTTKNMEARREAFYKAMEAALIAEGYQPESVPSIMARGSDGEYQTIRIAGAWIGYNAALDSICVELPKFADDYARNDGIAECQEALTAAGVPYK